MRSLLAMLALAGTLSLGFVPGARAQSCAIGQVQVQTTAGLTCSYLGFFDPSWFGAVGDGVTDNSPAVANTIAAATAAGVNVIRFPTGNFCLFSGMKLTAAQDFMSIHGQGSTHVGPCDHDTITAAMGDGVTQASRLRLVDIFVDGFDSPTATQPAIQINNCSACRLDRVETFNGFITLDVAGSSTYDLWQSDISSAYQDANMRTRNSSGGWAIRTAFDDQGFPNGIPAIPFTAFNWAALASIPNKQVEQTASGWVLQAMNGGTTGTVPPKITAFYTGSISGTTLTVPGGVTGDGIQIGQSLFTGYGAAVSVARGTKIIGGSGTTWTVNIAQTVPAEAMSSGFPRGVNIADGTVNWQVFSTAWHDGVRYDSGTGQSFEWGTDHGAFRFGINILNSLADQGAEPPSLINFTDMVTTGYSAGMIIQGGAFVSVENSQIQNCWSPGCAGIWITGTQSGHHAIHGNQFQGNPNGILYDNSSGSAQETAITGNVFTGSASNAYNVNNSALSRLGINANVCGGSAFNDISAAPKLVQSICP